jgi:16S rRNA (guanine527-N7)-methyltransferase
LLQFRDLLNRWNRVHNLTAVREPAQMLATHLVDCLALVPALRRELPHLSATARPRLLDVGSGGGLPGLVLAITHEAWQVDCIDAVGKKSAFVRQAIAELGLSNARALHGRVEALGGEPPYDLVISRAFASLADFCAWTRHLLRPRGAWAAMKGVVPEAEMAALPPWVEVFHVEQLHPPGLDARRCLVWMRPRTI